MAQNLDQLDISILRLLQEDARTPAREIGEKLHKSKTTIQSRIDAMRASGLIKRFTIEIDTDIAGLDFMTYTQVQLADHSKENLRSFEEQIIRFPEVLECHHVTGGHDFILRIAATDRKHYHDTLMDKLFDSFKVGHVETMLVMKTAKTGTILPVKATK